MNHADTVELFTDGLARICGLYGLNPLLGRLWGVLFLSPEPVSLDGLTEAVGAAKSTVSVSMRKLEGARLVQRQWKRGDRRDFYVAVTDPNTVLRDWSRLFFEPELAVWREIHGEADGALARAEGEWPEDEAREELQRRMRVLGAFADRMTGLLRALEADPMGEEG